MGQRLVITIKRGEKTIANAYYHWSAYSATALSLTKTILGRLELIEDEQMTFSSDTALAYDLLRATGAMIAHEQLPYLTDPAAENQDERAYLLSEYEKTREHLDRNAGLIALSEDQIQELQHWSEGDVSIDLENGAVEFGVLTMEEDTAYLKEEYDMTDEDLNNLPILSISLPETFDRDTIDLLDEAIEIAAQNEFGMFRAGESEYYQITQ